MTGHPVAQSVAMSRRHERPGALVTDASQDITGDRFFPQLLQVAADKANSANRLRHKHDAIRIAPVPFPQPERQLRRHAWTRQFVVGHRGMADVSGDQHFPIGRSRKIQLAVGQAAVLQFAVDSHPVSTPRQFFTLAVLHAETPGLLVVRSHVGDRIGLVRKRMQMLLQISRSISMSTGAE